MSTEKKTLDKEDSTYVEDRLNIIRQGMASVNQSIAVALQPLRTVDTVITKLTEQGKDDLVDRVSNICRTITADIETYGAEVTTLRTEYEKLLSRKPSRRRHLSNFNIETICLSQQLMDLNARILQTTVTVANDYTVIVNQLEDNVNV